MNCLSANQGVASGEAPLVPVMMEAARPLRPQNYRSYLILLARSSLRRAGPLAQKVDASDIVQDVLMRAHQAVDQFKGKTEGELMAWLRRILANKLTDATRHFARRKRDAALEQTYQETIDDSARRLERVVPADQTSPSQIVLRSERARRLADALSELPEDQRVAVELHHLSGFKLAEVAEYMERTHASVAGLLRRGLKALRVHLEGLE